MSAVHQYDPNTVRACINHLSQPKMVTARRELQKIYNRYQLEEEVHGDATIRFDQANTGTKAGWLRAKAGQALRNIKRNAAAGTFYATLGAILGAALVFGADREFKRQDLEREYIVMEEFHATRP